MFGHVIGQRNGLQHVLRSTYGVYTNSDTGPYPIFAFP